MHIIKSINVLLFIRTVNLEYSVHMYKYYSLLFVNFKFFQ